MTGSSIFDYCHAGDHEEIAEQLGLSLTGPSGLTSPSSAVGSDEGTGSQGTYLNYQQMLRKSHSRPPYRDHRMLTVFSLSPSPVHSCRHNDFELDECLQGLRPCFLHPHEVHFDETWLPLQVFGLQGKLLCTSALDYNLFLPRSKLLFVRDMLLCYVDSEYGVSLTLANLRCPFACPPPLNFT